jgi:hypothetical protein
MRRTESQKGSRDGPKHWQTSCEKYRSLETSHGWSRALRDFLRERTKLSDFWCEKPKHWQTSCEKSRSLEDTSCEKGWSLERPRAKSSEASENFVWEETKHQETSCETERRLHTKDTVCPQYKLREDTRPKVAIFFSWTSATFMRDCAVETRHLIWMLFVCLLFHLFYTSSYKYVLCHAGAERSY